jgi:hypothetical protein
VGQKIKAEWLRERAADCASLAERAPDVQSKAVLAEAAATWLRLAELVEKIERIEKPT